MKRTAFAIIALLFIGSMNLQAQEKKKSPPMAAEGKIGETMISINYHAPSVRGRTIFGGLEAWGKVWRAGANEATTIEFSNDVVVGGQDLAAGKYAFFVKPMEDGNWEAIFNTEAKQWGAYNMNSDNNALVLPVKAEDIENKEVLEYSIKDGMIHLEWADKRISMSVK